MINIVLILSKLQDILFLINHFFECLAEFIDEEDSFADFASFL